ncbi:hypothetical protein DCAR_0624186 [Daucus carota subsp. sativus]|uniref:Uncharacterized protein n=1 Tax=Daucus carota subsp. sativus TaxID=79200 RepID=A0A164VPI3_DAUCS|nr:hypothetical protein DCAR_0624186 [Daucus carota subsp. sativus]
MDSEKVTYVTITFLLFSLLLCSKAPTTRASRPLPEKTRTSYMEDFLRGHGFSVDEVKSSGPSSRGAGHMKVKGLPSLRTLKDSGPSPGAGHKSIAGDHH